jgi:excisionase family DNA binding protein
MVTTTHSRCELLSAEDAWVYAGRPVCRSGWYEAIRRGEIPHIRMGRRILIPRQALERLLAGELPGRGVEPNGE